MFGPSLGATLSVTVPLPVPEAPDTTVIAFGSLLNIVPCTTAPARQRYSTSVRRLPGTVTLPGVKDSLLQLVGSWFKVRD